MLTKEQIKSQGRNKEVDYPSSCEGCPNNPNNYDTLKTATENTSAKGRLGTPPTIGFDFSEDYIKEMGGDEDNNGIAPKEDWDKLEEEHY